MELGFEVVCDFVMNLVVFDCSWIYSIFIDIIQHLAVNTNIIDIGGLHKNDMGDFILKLEHTFLNKINKMFLFF